MKKIFLFVSFCISFHSAFTQLNPIAELKKNISIEFNESGQMTSFPSTYINGNGKICFGITMSKKSFRAPVAQLKSMLESAYAYINDETVKCSYSAIFSEPTLAAIELSFLEMLNLFTIDSCLLSPIHDSTIKKIEPYFPILQLQSAIQSQYRVLVFVNDNCVDTIRLTPGGSCEGDCITLSDCSAKKVRDFNCEACEDLEVQNLKYLLVYDNPVNSTIRTWIADQSSYYYKSFGADTLKTLFRPFEQDLKKIDTTLPNLKELRPIAIWLSYWLWLNAGKLVVDPLKQRSRATSQELIQEIANIVFEKSVLEETERLLKNRKDTIIRRAEDTAALTRYLREIRRTKLAIDDKINQIKNLTAQYESGFSYQSLMEKTVKYRGYLKPSQSLSAVLNRRLFPTIQFDGRNKYQPIPLNVWERKKIKAIPEDEWMYIALHNMPDSHKVLQFTDKALPLDDTDEFTKLVTEALKQLQSIRGLLGNAEIELFELLAAQGIVDTKGIADSLNVAALKTCDYSIPMLKDSYDNWRRLGFALPFRKADDLKISYSTPLFQSQLFATTPADAPYRDSVSIKMKIGSDTTLLPPIKFKVGKLRIVQFAAGIAFNQRPADVTRIDTSGGGFRVTSTDNRARAIIAAKIYPFRQFNLDHGFIPRYPLRRFSLFAGMEMLKPLRNFYIGGAYDVVPGLSFSTGVNYFQQTSYRVENNVITNSSRTYRKSGQYYSITVNPVLFAQFVKLFISSI